MGRIAAIDPGEIRVGLAVSDELKIIARTLPFVDAHGSEETAKRVVEALKDYEIELILVGRPVHMHGAAAVSAKRSEALAMLLREAGYEVRLVDERLSTVEASRKLSNAGMDSRAQRKKIDSAAAAVILQAHLDTVSSQGDF
jgi:putative Holliday junction resolvase